MAKTQEWWNEFWTKKPPVLPCSKESDETWYDLAWKVFFEYWYDLFKRLAPGKKMLECGCGTARVSQYMAQRGYQCTLLDYSENALKLAKSNFDSLSLGGQFVIGDLNHLSFPDKKFDIVFCGGVLEFFPDPQRPINEMIRVLRPGGVFSANLVPNKFSIQTIADIERTFVYSLRNLVKGRYRDVLKRVQHIPPDYNVNSLPLEDYINICKKSGLTSVVGLITSPFPEIALPRLGKKLYASLMKKLFQNWRKFNQSKSRWTEIWGITYTIYGIKK